jgi:ribosomal protein S18 acetylase RimI-like enzyme
MESAMTQPLTCRAAIPDDEAGILAVFAEVAPEVPTTVKEGTKELIARLVATEASLVAVDLHGKVVGYALAEGDGKGGISLIYLGVAKAARNNGISKTIISQLKEHGMPITASVRNDNASSMAERFKRFGFVERESVLEGETKYRWEAPAQR